MIDWSKANVTRQDMDLISKIATRAQRMGAGDSDRMSLMMDLEAAHTDIPLDLAGLLVADDFDFAHDVAGIYRHIDRENGQLCDCFVPRYALATRKAIITA